MCWMHLYRNMRWFSPCISLMILLLAGPVSCRRPAPRVLIRTGMGDITVELYPEQAPVTAANFLAHVEKGDYTNSWFYRVVRMDNQPDSPVKIQVIQGGLFYEEVVDSIPPIIHETTQETGIRHTNGIISMARNGPGTASTEFFICIGDQPSLDYGGNRNPDLQGFAAFGKVIEGMDIVRGIQSLPDEGQYLVEPVPIKDISVITSR
jgi:peptidyl-prolyl cis-trans isomerase A (cyclophilin A)